MLRVSALKKRDGFTLQAEFEAPTPGIVALFGRSGCGKTTLVNIISGLLEAVEARIQLDDVVLADTRAGISVPVERRRIGYVFQDARLFPHFSVLGNLRYGLKRSAPLPVRQPIAFDDVVSLLGLEPLLNRRPNQLSGGERQRAAVARALVTEPKIVLADEPTGNLDGTNAESVFALMLELNRELGTSLIVVTHDMRLASRMERIFAIERGVLTERPIPAVEV